MLLCLCTNYKWEYLNNYRPHPINDDNLVRFGITHYKLHPEFPTNTLEHNQVWEKLIMGTFIGGEVGALDYTLARKLLTWDNWVIVIHEA